MKLNIYHLKKSECQSSTAMNIKKKKKRKEKKRKGKIGQQNQTFKIDMLNRCSIWWCEIHTDPYVSFKRGMRVSNSSGSSNVNSKSQKKKKRNDQSKSIHIIKSNYYAQSIQLFIINWLRSRFLFVLRLSFGFFLLNRLVLVFSFSISLPVCQSRWSAHKHLFIKGVEINFSEHCSIDLLPLFMIVTWLLD